MILKIIERLKEHLIVVNYGMENPGTECCDIDFSKEDKFGNCQVYFEDGVKQVGSHVGTDHHDYNSIITDMNIPTILKNQTIVDVLCRIRKDVRGEKRTHQAFYNYQDRYSKLITARCTFYIHLYEPVRK